MIARSPASAGPSVLEAAQAIRALWQGPSREDNSDLWPLIERRMNMALEDGEPVRLQASETAGLIELLRLPALLHHLAEVMLAMDKVHPVGYPATRDGVFMGITTAVHELNREAIDAWTAARCKCETPMCGHADWSAVADEIEQAAAVAMRTVRSIRLNTVAPRG